MRTVVEREPGPSIDTVRGIEAEALVGFWRSCESIETVVVASRTVGYFYDC